MDEETETLIKPNVHRSVQCHDDFIESLKHRIPIVTVEPLILIYVTIWYLQGFALYQYIYYMVGIEYNITQPGKLAYVCNGVLNDSSEETKVDQLQLINSKYQMIISSSNSVTTIIFAPFYSIFSDRYGRRIMLSIAGIGLFIKSLLDVLIIAFKWPIYCFMITGGLYGCSGGWGFAINVCYCYIADITKSQSRTFRISLIDVISAVAGLIVSLLGSLWIQLYGYLYPYTFTVILAFVCVIYPIFLMKEFQRLADPTEIQISSLKQMKTLITIYINRPRNQSVLLIVVFSVFNMYYIGEMSASSLWMSYLMSFPICMSSWQIGVASSLNMVAFMIGIAICLLGLLRRLSDISVVIICLISGLIYSIQMAFVKTYYRAYIAMLTNPLSFCTFPIIKGYLSKRMEHNVQGALFGGLFLSETLLSAVIKVVILFFYWQTFHVLHGLIFLCTGSFFMVAIILAVISKVIERKFEGKNI